MVYVRFESLVTRYARQHIRVDSRGNISFVLLHFVFLSQADQNKQKEISLSLFLPLDSMTVGTNMLCCYADEKHL